MKDGGGDGLELQVGPSFQVCENFGLHFTTTLRALMMTGCIHSVIKLREYGGHRCDRVYIKFVFGQQCEFYSAVKSLKLKGI